MGEWAYLCLGEAKTVARLIANRSRLDGAFLPLMEKPTVLGTAGIPTMYEPVYCTYLDLDRLIDTCGLSDGQRRIVDDLMSGYTLTDIAVAQGCAQQTVDVQYRRAVAKITRRNEEVWASTYLH